MAGTDNFGGKRAAPFGKGGKRKAKVGAAKAVANSQAKAGVKRESLNFSKRDIALAMLDAAARKALAPSDFVFPASREYPIPDAEHASNALGRAKTVDEPPARMAVIRAAIKRRYPDLPALSAS